MVMALPSSTEPRRELHDRKIRRSSIIRAFDSSSGEHCPEEQAVSSVTLYEFVKEKHFLDIPSIGGISSTKPPFLYLNMFKNNNSFASSLLHIKRLSARAGAGICMYIIRPSVNHLERERDG